MRVRQALTILAAAFSTYLAARGLIPAEPVARPLPLAVGIALYLVTTALVLAAPAPATGRPSGGRLPLWATVPAVVVGAALPWIVSSSSDGADRLAPYVTWYIGGVGALMTIVAVRRRPLWAWLGLISLAAGCAQLIGLVDALAFGLVGSILWVGVGQLMQLFTDRAYADTVKLASLQQASAAWQSTQSVRRRERRERVQYALEVAAPVLTQVISSGGELTEEQREAAWLAEGTLRDELRGAGLLDAEVRAAIRALRERGAQVTVLDEGGLDGLAPEDRAAVRADLAATLRTAEAQRIIIRTASHGGIAATVVGRAVVGGGTSEDDDVVLWHEIPRPGA